MPGVLINVRDKRFYLRVWNLKKFCVRVIGTAFGNAHTPAEISLTLCDDAFIQKLNKKHRGKDKPTNVLSFENPIKPPHVQKTKFPETEFPWMAGDIVLSYDTLLRESRDQGISFKSHFAHLLIHGTLHLLGYDHMTTRAAKKMEAYEATLMKRLGFKNPYKD